MRWIAAIACVGCASVSHPTPAGDGRELVGMMWITAPQPWRTGARALGFATLGDTAVVAGAGGWIGALDLRTGAMLRERWLEAELWDVVALDRQRLLGIGRRGDEAIAMTIDAATLAATPVTLPAPNDRWLHVWPALLPDGSVLVAGHDLPLASYDPATWAPRRTLDARTGWERPVVRGGAVYAVRSTESDDTAVRFDLASGGSTELGPAQHVAAGGGAVARSLYGNADRIELAVDGVARPAIAGLEMAMAIDPGGRWLVVQTAYDEVEIHELPSGRLVHRVALAQSGTVVRGLEVTAQRATLIADARVRVIDLASGAITAVGGAPIDRPMSLSVSDAGEVAYVGSEVWRFAGGKLVATQRLDGLAAGVLRLEAPPGEVGRYAILGHDDAVRIASIDDGRLLARVAVGDFAYPGWFDGTDVAVVTGDRHRQLLQRTERDRLVPQLALRTTALVHDVDLRGGRALVSNDGTAVVVALAGTASTTVATLAIPGCSETTAVDDQRTAQLERGGTRVVTSDRHEVAVWDGAAHVASARFDDEVVRAAFVPHAEELVVLSAHHLALWSPRTGELRAIGVSGIVEIAVSPNGRRLAAAFSDDRVGVIDLDALRTGLSVDRAVPAAPPPACPAASPLLSPSHSHASR